LVRKNALASPRLWLCLTSPHLARPPHAPQSAGSSKPAPVRPCPSPPPPREECPRPPQLDRASAALTTLRRRNDAPSIRRPKSSPPPPPRARPPREASPRPPQLHRGSTALTTVRRRNFAPWIRCPKSSAATNLALFRFLISFCPSHPRQREGYVAVAVVHCIHAGSQEKSCSPPLSPPSPTATGSASTASLLFFLSLVRV
jgi:hypothetical protein